MHKKSWYTMSLIVMLMLYTAVGQNQYINFSTLSILARISL